MDISKKEIIKSAIKIPKTKEKAGVYFLLKNKKIVYVGQTTNGVIRIFFHTKDKDFDSYYFIPIKDKDKRHSAENNYILEFNPKYNKIVNAKKDKAFNYISLKMLRELFKKDSSIPYYLYNTNRLKKYITILNIKTKEYHPHIYIPKNEIDKIKNYMLLNKGN